MTKNETRKTRQNRLFKIGVFDPFLTSKCYIILHHSQSVKLPFENTRFDCTYQVKFLPRYCSFGKNAIFASSNSYKPEQSGRHSSIFAFCMGREDRKTPGV